MGSSPRVRGTLPIQWLRVVACRIIPACAGNTTGANTATRRTRDHPRVCGEHRIGLMLFNAYQGSSPRVRGTPHVELQFERGRGIIPACAGNTYSDNATDANA